MSRMFSNTVIMAWSLFFLIFTGCAASGPFIKPDQDSRSEYVDRHSELTEEIKQAILEGRVIEGMSKEGVRVTWGAPIEVEDSTNSENLLRGEERWYYKGAMFKILAPNCRISFQWGIVDGIYCGQWYDK